MSLPKISRVQTGYACLIFLAVSNSHASVYSFGSGCGTQGAWTQSALAQTHLLIQAAEALKNNEKCKGIESIVPKIQIAQNALQTPEKEINRASRMESIPGEIGALRTMANNASLASDVTTLLGSKVIEGAALTAEATAASVVPLFAVGSELNRRLNKVSRTGLSMLDQIMLTLPTYDECLIGQPDQAAALVGASIKLAASFASSGEGVTPQFSNSMSNLISFLRNRKFSRVLRKLNQNDFWTSMSCMLETTSQSYCSAQDGYEILRYGVHELQPKIKLDGRLDFANPLEGYYLLTQNVPIVSDWLQKIQIGIDPKLTTDATRKNNVWDTVTACYKDSNEILGRYAEDMKTMSGLKDISSKRNAVLDMIRKIRSMMYGNPMAGASVNFFTMSVFADMIPFYLIGLDSIPFECASNSKGGFIIPWETWMQNGGKYRPEFDDPDALAVRVGLQLKNIINGAQDKASAYFRQWMIVDMPNLVNEAITSQRFTVVESLRLIHKYLGHLAKRVVQYNGDYAILPSIRDTQARIKKVLDTFEAVRQLEERRPQTDEEQETLAREVQQAYEHVIETAFDQFNVLLQRDSFMINRMSTFVSYDYALRIRNKVGMTDYQHDLLIATGKSLLDTMLDVHGLNPASVVNDLSAAQVVNKRNLESLEALLRDSLVPVIEELDSIAKGERPSDLDLTNKSMWRAQTDWVRAFKDHPALMTTLASIGFVIPSFAGSIPYVNHVLHSDRYPMYITTEPTFRGVDDPKYQYFAQFKAKFCMHTLAFEDRTLFEDLCKGSVLKSVFETPNNQTIQLDAAYDHYMNKNTRKLPTTAENICAFRDYSRRNLVYWLLHDLNRQAEANP